MISQSDDGVTVKMPQRCMTHGVPQYVCAGGEVTALFLRAHEVFFV